MFKYLVVLLSLTSFTAFGEVDALRQFSEFKPVKLKSFQHEHKLKIRSSRAYSYPGVGYKYILRDLHSARPESFNYYLSYNSSFLIAKDKFELIQEIVYVRDEFHFLEPKKKIIKKQSIKIRVGDKLLSNNKGSYLVIKRQQPGALSFKFLVSNDLYDSYFEEIENFLFKDEALSYCFLDYAIMHSAFDCEKIAIKDFSPYRYIEANYILINTVEKTIKVGR